jgi:hypothetical protein
MMTASTSGTCSRISKPVVPWPAKMLGWSNLKIKFGDHRNIQNLWILLEVIG